MTWVLWALCVLVVGGCVILATGRGGELPDVHDDRPDVLVPGGRPLRGDDLRAVGFTTAVRGYRMAEVDALLARLALELDERDGPGDDHRPGDGTPDVTGDVPGDMTGDDRAG